MSSSMLFSFCDTMAFSKLYREAIALNLDDRVYRKLRDDPIGWLNTLPMYEYAHVMMKVCAHHLGGHPAQYVKVLFNLLLSPLLTRYYKELELHRFMDAEIERQYDRPRTLAEKNETRVGCRNKMCMCTARTKAAIRFMCEQYTFMKDLPLSDSKIQYWSRFVAHLAEFGNIKDWNDEMKKFAKDMSSRDFADLVSRVDVNAGKDAIAKKLLEVASTVYGRGPEEGDGSLSLNTAREILNWCIDAFNVDLADGTNSWKVLGTKLNELIDAINNQKKRKIS